MSKMICPRAKARNEFLKKCMPWMMSLFNRAEAYGIDWRKIPMSALPGHIAHAEEFSSPEPMRVEPFPSAEDWKP